MRLHFARAGVEEILDTLRNATKFRVAYDFEDDIDPPPLVWLVGDRGIYLMANNWLAAGESAVVTYARECDPNTLDFDTWWDVKQEAFGGDDGVNNIDLADLERVLATYPPNMDLEIELTP